MILQKAVKNAVEYCIRNKVLEEFLKKYGAEVIEMIMEEYTLEDEIEAERESARMEGWEEGLEEGREEGDKGRQIKIARKMKNAGKPISEIIEFTELSPEEIDKL